MEMTQQDYDDRKTRVAAGNGTDEDLRLVKLYESEGFSSDETSAGKRQEAGAEQHTPAPAGHDADATARPVQDGDVKPTRGSRSK